MRSFWIELIVPAAVVAFGLVYFVDTTGLARQAGFFPRTMMAVMPALLLFVLVDAWRSRHTTGSIVDSEARESGSRKPLWVILTAFAFVGLIAVLGYFPAAVVFVAGSLWLFGARPLEAAVVGVAVPAALYALFVLGFGIRV